MSTSSYTIPSMNNAGPRQVPAEKPYNAPRPEVRPEQKTLMDVFYDGFLMLFLLKNNNAPQNASVFAQKVKAYLQRVEGESKALGLEESEINDAKYAFCATLDEIVLQSKFSIRDEWVLRPLQLTLFGDQLAGRNFYRRLEVLREQGASRLQTIEVFYMCLLMGFQGQFIFESEDRLYFFTKKLGEEIATMRGRRTGFAPHVAIPDNVAHALKNDLPLWAIASALCFLGVLAFLGISFLLNIDTSTMLANYQNLIDLGPRSAHLTISLP